MLFLRPILYSLSSETAHVRHTFLPSTLQLRLSAVSPRPVHEVMLARRNGASDLLNLASIERLRLVDRLHWLESVSLDVAFSTNPTNKCVRVQIQCIE